MDEYIRLQTKKCKGCGEDFMMKRAQQLYCSPACRTKTRAYEKKTKRIIVCANPECGIEFKAAGSRQRFCSISCKNAVYRKKIIVKSELPAYFLQRHATPTEITEAEKFVKAIS